MTTDPPVLGLVAGDGVYPEYIVRGARRRTPELRIVAVGFKGETNPAVIPCATLTRNSAWARSASRSPS